MVDVGWYRTTIRSFEREIYTIPNSVFSRNVVLNITRKQKEWRFFEFFGTYSAKATHMGTAQACTQLCQMSYCFHAVAAEHDVLRLQKRKWTVYTSRSGMETALCASTTVETSRQL